MTDCNIGAGSGDAYVMISLYLLFCHWHRINNHPVGRFFSNPQSLQTLGFVPVSEFLPWDEDNSAAPGISSLLSTPMVEPDYFTVKQNLKDTHWFQLMAMANHFNLMGLYPPLCSLGNGLLELLPARARLTEFCIETLQTNRATDPSRI